MNRAEEKQLIKELGRFVKRLASPPTDISRLIRLLEQTESLLTRLKQMPSETMIRALGRLMEELASNRLFVNHLNMDVRVAIAACFGQVSRITAPDNPYNEEDMRGFFRIIVDAFVLLDDMSSRSYHKRVLILETISRIRTCLMMLDYGLHDLIFEMFNHFLKTIRSSHPDNVFKAMENIMTLIIKESDDIPPELLTCLLTCVKKDNQDLSPIACALGEQVIENCREKLKPYFVKLMEAGNLPLRDYDDLVGEICFYDGSSDESKSNDSGENLADDSRLSERTISNELPQGYQRLESKVSSQGEVCSAAGVSAKSVPSSENLLIENGPQNSRENSGDFTNHSLGKIEKETENFSRSKGKNACNLQSDSLSGFPNEPRSDATQLKRGHLSGLMFTTSATEMRANLDVSPSEGKISLPSNQNEEEQKLKSKRKRLCKTILDSEGKLHKQSVRNIFEASQRKVAMDESLVGSQIRVWWPDDQQFYEGVVESFDPGSAKHTVFYLDGDVEHLLLNDEIWEFVENDESKTDGKKEKKKEKKRRTPSQAGSSDWLPKKKAKVSSNDAQNVANAPMKPGSVGTSTGKPRPNTGKSLSIHHGGNQNKPEDKKGLGDLKVGTTFSGYFTIAPSPYKDLSATTEKQDAVKFISEHNEPGASGNKGSNFVGEHSKSITESPGTCGFARHTIPEAGSVHSDSALMHTGKSKDEKLEAGRKPSADPPLK